MDELAKILFPGNSSHQRIFLAIFNELKYSSTGFLTSLSPLCGKYNFSPRMLETVRSKMLRMGIIDHVSRFNKRYGYREGWVFSGRFIGMLIKLSDLTNDFKTRRNPSQERKDRDLFRYI